MATAPKKEVSTNPLGPLQSMLELAGGQKTTQTTSPGDISYLQQLFGQLQGADYNALLQQVFQQAAGQIPGLQAAYTNAVGARSGGNSAVQAALNELLKQTSIAGADKVIGAQLQNQQIQQNAAGNIAQATRGSTQTAKQGTDLGQAAKTLAILQAVSKLTGADKAEGGIAGQVGRMFGVGTGTAAAANTPPAALPNTPTAEVYPMSTAPVVNYNPVADVLGVNYGQSTAADASGLGQDISLSFPTPGTPSSQDMSYADWYQPSNINDLIGVEAPSYESEMSLAPQEWFQSDPMSWF